MPHAQLTDEIRGLVTRTFSQMGVAAPGEFRESILIRSGHYVGRKFEAEGAHAVWFAEENQLKFYAADGRFSQLPAPRQEMLVPRRIAA